MSRPVRGVAGIVLAGAVTIAAAALHAQGVLDAPEANTRATGGAARSMVTAASGRCGTCHPRERVAFETSRHAGEDMHCTSCHGGNDQSLDAASAHQGNGWRGSIARADIPAQCASCHSDERRMRPYDLPVDQYALYQTSAHGVKLRAGDTKVAVCSDCHGAHDILGGQDPASRVYVTNIPRTCGQCHGDTTLMRPRHVPDTYHDYLASVHGRALLEKGNLRAPTCVSCHGVHGAAPPEVGDVSKICGRCHTAERRYYLAGPHAAGMAAKQLAECSSCHGDHAIAASDSTRLAQGCLRCHPGGTRDAAVGAKLLADYRAASAELTQADRMVTKADAVPIQTDDYRARLEEARTYLREALIAAHAVDPELMTGFSTRALSVGTEVRSEIQGKLTNILTNKVALLVFWFYVALTIVVLRRFRDRPAGRD